jgi:hypothetical protein
MLECCADDLQVLGEAKVLAEGPGRNPPVQNLSTLLRAPILAACHHQRVFLLDQPPIYYAYLKHELSAQNPI